MMLFMKRRDHEPFSSPLTGADLDRAVAEISTIHEYMARSTMFRGYRAMPSFIVGVGALIAALVQSVFFPSISPLAFVLTWCAIAVVGLLIGGGAIALQYSREDSAGRARAREVTWLFLPCVFAGLLLTIGIATSPGVAQNRLMVGGPLNYLPAAWALFFGVGVFSIRPYLPAPIVFVALYYFVCGTILLTFASKPASLSPWGMGLTFGLGNIFSAIVLYICLERKRNTP
jgi:hypothetical protein